ncbi:MAG TPA: glycosyltransferase family 4 protein [Planktothrix sp.]
MLVRSFSQNGGLELYTYKVVTGILLRGHDVTVICEENDTQLAHPQLTVRKFPPAPRGIGKSLRLLHYVKYASDAVKESGPYDIVHSQHLPCTVANVVTFHNHTAARLSQVGLGWEQALSRVKMMFVPAYQLRDRFDRMLCSTASCLIFPAKICMDDFVNTYKVREINPHALLAIVAPGANLEKAPLVDRQPTAPFTFLFVGKGFRKKGLDVLLQACAILRKSGVKFQLLIAGLREKPIDRLRLQWMGLQGCIQYLGFCKNMNEVYARASAIVLPSRIEPFGMAPIEGAANGLVPIVSSMCGAAEAIEDGVSGYILKNCLDAAELARLMRSLIEDPTLTATMASHAHCAAWEFPWDRAASETLAAYEKTLSIIKS